MLKRVYILLLSVLTVGHVFAQADADAVKLADEMYGFGDKRDALDVYLQAASINPNNVRANYMAGKCYQETIEKEKSVKYLEKAYKLDKNISQDIFYLIGKGYQFGGQFDKAIENFNAYKREMSRVNPKNKEELIGKADKHIVECQNGKIFYSQKATKELVNIGGVVNSEYAEYSPVISADESILIFTSRRQGTTGNKKDRDNEFFEDIYMSTKLSNGGWSDPKNIGTTINTEFHEACNGLSPDGKELYIYRELNGGDIFKCTQMADGNWSKPERMEHINTKHEEASITFSGDGKLMIFSSDRPKGNGRLDLYMCKKDEKGQWSTPVNIGNTLNTKYDEDSPFLDHEGKTLFFSSSGHNSMGGYDIFKSTYEDGKWSAPVNLGYPVNTTDDDIYYVESGDGVHGYYASVRNDGHGEKDIYMVTNAKEPKENVPQVDTVAKVVEEKKDTLIAKAEAPIKEEVKPKEEPMKEELVSPAPQNEVAKETKKEPEPIKEALVADIPPPPTKPTFKSVTVKGRVFDSESGDPLEASVDVLDEAGKKIRQIATSPDGYYSLVLNEKKNRNLTFVVHPSGFVKKSLKVSVKPAYEETETVQDLALSKYVVGKKYILRNIYFEFNQATITSESEPELQQLFAMLEKSPNVKIEIGGHTDYVGTAEYNRQLSQKRAQAVVDYLIGKGISPDRLRAVGYGKQHPLASNDDEAEGRELNRRTEFKIL